MNTPEAKTSTMQTSFNPKSAKIFLEKLEKIISRYGFPSSVIYNVDELAPSFLETTKENFRNLSCHRVRCFHTGVITLQKVQRINGKKCQHEIQHVTSRKRGELLSQVGIMDPIDNSMPLLLSLFSQTKISSKRNDARCSRSLPILLD